MILTMVTNHIFGTGMILQVGVVGGGMDSERSKNTWKTKMDTQNDASLRFPDYSGFKHGGDFWYLEFEGVE